MSSSLPVLVLWDLDGTLWSPDMYLLSGGSPFQFDAKTLDVKDRFGDHVQLLGDAREILKEWYGRIQFGTASACDYPEWARECLSKIRVTEETTLRSYFESSICEIYKASTKRTHFQNIREKTGVEFHDMIFFDNEYHNIKAVKTLGVHCVYTPHGVTNEIFREVLCDFANSKQKNEK
jgi:magnesium-dependent phosphatase 1